MENGSLRSNEDAPEFLVVFARHNCYFNMRFQELEALAQLYGAAVSSEDLYVDERPTALSESPLVHVRLQGGQAVAQRMCERSVLIKAVLEVWGSGQSYKDAVQQALAVSTAVADSRRALLAPPATFQIRVVAFGRTLTMDDKREVMECLRPLFQGDEVVDLHNPEISVWALEEHAHHSGARTHLGKETTPPQRVFVGRQVAGGRSVDKKTTGEKSWFHRYELSQRAVLGPTTLENELAFIMANLACVRRGSIAMDPFCGTGGVLVALGHFGAHVYGGEIDIRVIKGWSVAYVKNRKAVAEIAKQRATQQPRPVNGQAHQLPAAEAPPNAVDDGQASMKPTRPHVDPDGKDIFTNFLQYQLAMPEIVLCDLAALPWRTASCGWVDCIVTDPPYGVRAGAKKQGREGGPLEIQDLSTYIPSKVGYGQDELNGDLLEFASRALTDGGRLVFLLPVDLADFLGIDRAASERQGGPRGSIRDAVYPEDGRKKDPRLSISEQSRDPLLLDEQRYLDYLPQHSNLKLVGASLQILSGGLGRLLVVMQRLPREPV